MSWSLDKEMALRRMVARGVSYVDALTALSDVSSNEVDRIEAELPSDKTQELKA